MNAEKQLIKDKLISIFNNELYLELNEVFDVNGFLIIEDSLDKADFIFRIQKNFDIDFDMDYDGINTFDKIIDCVYKEVNEK